MRNRKGVITPKFGMTLPLSRRRKERKGHPEWQCCKGSGEEHLDCVRAACHSFCRFCCKREESSNIVPVFRDFFPL